MICINCNEPSTSVTNSRPHKKQASVWRRRRCGACGHTFTTSEAPLVGDSLEIIYADGSTKPFSLPRLSLSLAKTLAHRKENAADSAYHLGETVYQVFMRRGNGSRAVTLHECVVTTHEVLERFDALAGLQYAAKHRLITTTRKTPGRPRLQ